ncbi:MAG: helix-turn-helix domain-containing protein [Bacteroidia bacterium]|nr:helix-turn-helix domain-containing protein [Bacteroidia bacterium]
MDITLSIYALIPFLTILQASVFGSLLVYRGWKEERKSDLWLALLLMLMALSSVPFMLGWLGIDFLWEKLTFLPWDGYELAIPPVIYFFLLSLTNVSYRFERKNLIYFLPYCIYVIYHLLIGIQGNPFAKEWWHSKDVYINPVFDLILLIMQIYLLIKSVRLYLTYRKWVEARYADLEKVSFTWFRNYLYVLTVVVTVQWIFRITDYFLDYNYAEMWWIYLTNTFFTYYLSISGYSQGFIPNLVFPREPVPGDEIMEKISFEEGTAPAKALLNNEELEAWKLKVEKLIEKEAFYLNPDISLPDLAEKMNTNTSVLSYVINKGFNKNFNDFINELRVNLCIQKMKNPAFSHYTLLGIAFSCGFNSKTTFNRAFKKTTGKNPKEYFSGTESCD